MTTSPEQPPTCAPVLILVARSETRINTYREALELRGFACHPVTELRELPACTCRQLFHGILLDMPIITKASPGDKALVADILQALPSAYLNIAPATDTIKLLPANQLYGTARSLNEFLTACGQFTPRLVRPNDRVPLHLNALVSHQGRDQEPEQTVSLNLSRQGCFLFSTCTENQTGQEISIRFIGMDDPTPIIAIIRWVRPWGSVNQMPGIGVTFERISESQSRQLEELMTPLRPR